MLWLSRLFKQAAPAHQPWWALPQTVRVQCGGYGGTDTGEGADRDKKSVRMNLLHSLWNIHRLFFAIIP